MTERKEYKVLYYTLSLYGLCRFTKPPLSGVLRKTLLYIPVSYIIGCAFNSYIMYSCNKNLRCLYEDYIDICDQQCILKNVVKGMRNGEISIFHAIFKEYENIDWSNSIKNYFLYWKRIQYASKIHVLPRLAINSVTGSVHVDFEEGEKRGYSYGDEVFTDFKNDFHGYIVVSKNYEEDVRELLRYILLGRIGHRGKYCFPEIKIVSEKNIEEIELNLEGDDILLAPCGLAFTHDFWRENILIKNIIKADINVLSLKKIRVRKNDEIYCNTIYDLLHINSDQILFAEPMVQLKIKKKIDISKFIWFGIKNNTLSSLGWNRLVTKKFLGESNG